MKTGIESAPANYYEAWSYSKTSNFEKKIRFFKNSRIFRYFFVKNKIMDFVYKIGLPGVNFGPRID